MTAFGCSGARIKVIEYCNLNTWLRNYILWLNFLIRLCPSRHVKYCRKKYFQQAYSCSLEVFEVVLPVCDTGWLVCINQRFVGTYPVLLQGDSMFVRKFASVYESVRNHNDVTTRSTSPPPWEAHSPDDWDSMFVRNSGICVRVYTASCPRRTSTFPQQREPRIILTSKWCSKFIRIFLIQLLLTYNFCTVIKIPLIVMHALHVIIISLLATRHILVTSSYLLLRHPVTHWWYSVIF
jgi:hypothetical protein